MTINKSVISHIWYHKQLNIYLLNEKNHLFLGLDVDLMVYMHWLWVTLAYSSLELGCVSPHKELIIHLSRYCTDKRHRSQRTGKWQNPVFQAMQTMVAFDNFTTVLLKTYHVHFWCISVVTFENYFISKQICSSNAGGTFMFTFMLRNLVILAYKTVVIIIWFVFYIWKWMHLNFSAQFPSLYVFIIIVFYFSYYRA